MNDMAVLANEQGENLEIISEDLMNTNKNLVEANKELVVANNLQRKSRRKYCLFALLLVVLVSVVIGVIFFFRS
jgi:t-SNARE complex subunit (syntaxin)